MKLEPEVLSRIDAVVGNLAVTDPAKTVSPDTRPS